METKQLANYLNELLKIEEIKDKSLNGLVVNNKGKVDKVALAVDASLDSFKKAKQVGANFLIVHHGLWWAEPLPLCGSLYRRIKFLLEENIALYVAHLPLDMHPEFGNNAQAAKLLAWPVKKDFGKHNGLLIGKEVFFNPPRGLEDLVKDLKDKLKTNPTVWDFGPKDVKRLGYVSGDALALLPQAVEAGLDVYVTGEPKHSYYWMAKEEKINVIFVGHYTSETLGVKAIGKHIKNKFNLKVEFLHLSTGY
ncbi:Nif3-like dinuclear metal center hexameric protein [Candidatus Aerophobetes bacterium]|nr:Nif3-like dinuclear metal center hexameric protein [Candidatus Aerophobetes bacterium]